MPASSHSILPAQLPAPELARAASAELEHARLAYWEEPGRALAVATACLEQARRLGSDALQSRALALQGAVCLHRGDLRGAFALAAEAEQLTGDDLQARVELAALNTHLHFFSGSYGASLQWANSAVELADLHGDPALRLHARRMACLALANVGVDDLAGRFAAVLELAVAQDSPWEQAIAHNDIAHLSMVSGDLETAEAHLDRGLELASAVKPSQFLQGVLYATRSELRLNTGRPRAALADARRAVADIIASTRDPNPYLLGMAVLAEVQALLALNRVEHARYAGMHAVERLGDRVPQAGSMILTAVAGALRAAGRAEEAYDTLARANELEREALQEFAHLQLGLERARVEAAAHRHEAEILREQADRDWLTGLRNRRYLARAGGGLALTPDGAISLAVLDLDHFKSINDRYGHQVGDEVLVRVAQLLVDHVRSEDIVVRTGGEEFAVLMPGAAPAEAETCCERLCAVIGAEPWEDMAPGLSLTASIGVVSTPSYRDIHDLERVADQRLYAAKRAGRDCVVGELEAA